MDARKDEDAMILLIVPDKYIVHIDQPFDSGRLERAKNSWK